MTLTVKIGEAKTCLSELIARVEAGEEVVIQRGNQPIAKFMALAPRRDVAAVIAEVKALRAKAKPVTAE